MTFPSDASLAARLRTGARRPGALRGRRPAARESAEPRGHGLADAGPARDRLRASRQSRRGPAAASRRRSRRIRTTPRCTTTSAACPGGGPAGRGAARARAGDPDRQRRGRRTSSTRAALSRPPEISTGAEAEYRRAVELSPNLPGAHYALGRLLQREGKKEEADRELATHHDLYERALHAVSASNAQKASAALAWKELEAGKASEALTRFRVPAREPRLPSGSGPGPLPPAAATRRPFVRSRRPAQLAPDDHRIELLLVTERSRAAGSLMILAALFGAALGPGPRPATARSRSRDVAASGRPPVRARPGRHARAPASGDRGLRARMARLRQRRVDGPLRRAIGARSRRRRPPRSRRPPLPQQPRRNLHRRDRQGRPSGHRRTGSAPSRPTTTTTASWISS